VDPVKVTDVDILGLGLGKSIYSKEQMEEFVQFQDSQNTQRAYQTETAELAYLGRSGGEWGLGLTDLAKDQIVEAVGYNLIPLYGLVRPTVNIIFIMFIVVMVRMLLDIKTSAIVITSVQGCGFWMFGALWDTAFQVTVSPIRWTVEKGREGAGHIKIRWRQGQPTLEPREKQEHLTIWRFWRIGRPPGIARCMDCGCLKVLSSEMDQAEIRLIR
jgi:hypothetical protein